MSKKVLSVMVAGVLGMLGVSYLFAVSIVKERLEDAVTQLQLDIATQETTIATLSEAMSRGGVDDVTATVIKDCSADERTRFDSLLGRLTDGLPRPELTELSRLFDRCASYYARQKAVMAARFVREVEVYDVYTQRLLLLAPETDVAPYASTIWRELAALEQAQSDLFESLVDLQGKIIEELLVGRLATGPEISALLSTVRETQEMQAYNVIKMNELRAQVPSAL